MFEQLRELRNQYGYDVYAIVSGEKGPLVDKLNLFRFKKNVCKK